MALGVMMVVAVLLIHGIVTESFRSNSSLGYNMIVGAKGGKLQLVLNTVYYLSQPVENIPYSYYMEFLSAEQQHKQLARLGGDQRGRLSDGEYSGSTHLAIPVCLGDYYKSFRVVGTTTSMFDELVFDPDRGRKFEFSAGRNFVYHSRKHGFFEAVVGATVAREQGLKIGDTIQPTHGAPEEEQGHQHEDKFHIVGILKPSGTPNDRAVFVNIEGFYLLEDHAKPVESEEDAEADHDGENDKHTGHDHGEHGHAHHGHHHQEPLPIAEREVTAILLRTDMFGSMYLINTINEGPVAQAVLPVAEIYNLLRFIVGPIQKVFLAITVMICVVSGLSILVSIYNSMSDRQHEIAVMRALGAGRSTVLVVVLLESIFLSLGGGFLGWIGGHGLIAAASPQIEAATGVPIGLFDIAPPVNVLEIFRIESIIDTGWTNISAELLLIPGLILLAIVVGFLPALAAYRTDVAKALSANP